MRGLIRFSVIVPVVVAGFGAGVLALWPIGAPEPAAFPPGDAERGAYLARASGCVSCHTNAAAKGLALAGGRRSTRPLALSCPRTSPRTPPPGSRLDHPGFRQGCSTGISPEGDPYYPVFTYSFYAGFTDQEIADLWEAFRTVPPVAMLLPRA